MAKIKERGLEQVSLLLTMNIIQTAIENGSFGTLVAAVTAADFADTLNGAGPFTVFAGLE